MQCRKVKVSYSFFFVFFHLCIKVNMELILKTFWEKAFCTLVMLSMTCKLRLLFKILNAMSSSRLFDPLLDRGDVIQLFPLQLQKLIHCVSIARRVLRIHGLEWACGTPFRIGSGSCRGDIAWTILIKRLPTGNGIYPITHSYCIWCCISNKF